jgi:transposase-like protein
MSTVQAEVLKEYVNSQKFSSTAEVMEAMQDMFRDVLQQVIEGELDKTLGYGKSERPSNGDEKAESKNYRNGYSGKTVKTQIGEVQVKVEKVKNSAEREHPKTAS